MSKTIERVARAMMAVTAIPAGALRSEAGDVHELPVLSSDPDYDDLPSDGMEGTDEDEITQEAVLRLARAAIEALRDLDPHVAARAADKLGIAPSDVTRLVGTWHILIDEALS